MSNWVVVYDDAFQGWTNARVTASSKESALSLARDRRRQGHEAHRIEGPNGRVINKEEIERWMATHLERESKLQRSAHAAGGARALMALHGI